MGLEPIRLPTRPSNVRVCQFRHSCIIRFLRPASEARKSYYTRLFGFVNPFFCKKAKKRMFPHIKLNLKQCRFAVFGRDAGERRYFEHIRAKPAAAEPRCDGTPDAAYTDIRFMDNDRVFAICTYAFRFVQALLFHSATTFHGYIIPQSATFVNRK